MSTKHTVHCSILNGHTFETRIACDDESGFDDACVIVTEVDDAKEACIKSAKILRELADRFDKLALEEKPCHRDTHKKINTAS